MAQTMAGMAQIIDTLYAPKMAEDFAYAMCGGHPFSNKDFDREKWESLRDDFLERVDTPEKLMKVAAAMYPYGEGED
jgi:hypothetical protein